MATSIESDSTAQGPSTHGLDSLQAPPDGCPECVNGRHYPYRSALTDDGGIRGWYCCSFCNHRWYCSWSIEWAGKIEWA